MAFARSRTVFARSDVSSHMVKWWKGHKPTDGQVRRWIGHLASSTHQPLLLPSTCSKEGMLTSHMLSLLIHLQSIQIFALFRRGYNRGD